MAGQAAAEGTPPPPPKRVVSINLCTDQLALMLAAPGQLVSVSDLASDPRSSPMVEAASALPANHARAEEVYLLKPDLVLAGAFTSPATVSMLRRIGVRVEVMYPAYSLADVRDRIAEMGALLHREEEAAAMLADFDARLAALRADIPRRPRVANYNANGYTPGSASLSGDILRAAGFANVADDLGIPRGGFLPLESLALSDPDGIVSSRRFPGASRSEEILDHPVVKQLRAGRFSGAVADRDWVCGTPNVLHAIERLAALRQSAGPAERGHE